MKPECLVGFYGLNRSLRWTGESIRRNVLESLARRFNVTRVAHFNKPDLIHSPRSGELMVPSTMDGIEHLELHRCEVEKQTDDGISHVLPIILNTPLKFEPDPDGIIRKNVLYQLYSLSRLGRMLDEQEPNRFSLFALLRADLEYIDEVPTVDIAQRIGNGEDLITPSWHQFGGLNDRFAFASRRGAHVYLNRLDRVASYCESQGEIHSEAMLKYVAESAGLSLGFIDTRARRVRATGEFKAEAFNV
jgi:hypothetical protein